MNIQNKNLQNEHTYQQQQTKVKDEQSNNTTAIGKFFRSNLVCGNEIADWLENKDKVCTDRKDDGKLSVGEMAISTLKGVFGIVKTAVNHPIATIATTALGGVAVAATGGAILPALVTLGGALGVGMMGYGAISYATAKTDGDAKKALETFGEGLFAFGTSAMSANSALKSAGQAGVKSAQGLYNRNISSLDSAKGIVDRLKALWDCGKISKESLSVGYSNLTTSFKTQFGLLSNLEICKNNYRSKINRMIMDDSRMAKYADENTINNLLNNITEENQELASKLLQIKDFKYAFKSKYSVNKDNAIEYLTKTFPKILKSQDPEVIKTANYILDNNNICDKFYSLKILTPENAAEIRELKPYVDVYEINPNLNIFERGLRNIRSLIRVALGKEPLPPETLYYDNVGIQRQVWNKYMPTYKREELLPFIEETKGNNHILKIFAESGKVPNVPGATYNKTYKKFVIFESTSPKTHNVSECQNIAKNLLNQYGYKDLSQSVFNTTTP